MENGINALLLLLPLLKTYHFCNFRTEIKLLILRQVNLYGDTFNKGTLVHQRTLDNPPDTPIIYRDFLMVSNF